MDYLTFKNYYLSASIQFIWDIRIIEDYLPVFEEAAQETLQWFSMGGVPITEQDFGIAVLDSKENHTKRVALYIRDRRIKQLGSIYSIFREHFSIATKGHDDRFGTPFPPRTLEGCKRLAPRIGKTDKDAERIWRHAQSLRRGITNFMTLANKSINRQRKVPPQLRFRILKRDHFRCVFCGRTSDQTKLHVDHIVPVSKGGRNDPNSLATSCEECNLGKGVQSIEEFFPRLRKTSTWQ